MDIALAKIFVVLDGLLDENKKAGKDLERDLDKAELQLRDAMLDEGINNFSFMGKTIFLNSTTRANCPVANVEKLQTVLATYGQNEIVKPRANAQTLSSYVREIGVDNLPEDVKSLITVTTTIEVRLRN